MINIFHIIPYGKSTMSKHLIGTRFDTLEHIAGETLVILYVHPLIEISCSVELSMNYFYNIRAWTSFRLLALVCCSLFAF